MNTLPFPTKFRPSPNLAIIIGLLDSFVVSVHSLYYCHLHRSLETRLGLLQLPLLQPKSQITQFQQT